MVHTPFRCYEILGRIDPAVHDLLARLQAGAPKPGTWTPGTLFFRSIEHHLNAADPGDSLRTAAARLLELRRHAHRESGIVVRARSQICRRAERCGGAGSRRLPPGAFLGCRRLGESGGSCRGHSSARRPEFVASEAEALATISAPGFDGRKGGGDQSAGAFELPSQQIRAGQRDLLPARIDSYAPGQVRISAAAPEGGWLVLSDLYYPGWEAFIDGVPATDPSGELPVSRCRIVPGKAPGAVCLSSGAVADRNRALHPSPGCRCRIVQATKYAKHLFRVFRGFC